MTAEDTLTDVLVVGGGVAGLSVAIFTARADLDTLVVSEGESILARNAHLENYPGFPDGVNARRFLSLTREQAETAGARFAEGLVVDAAREGDGFRVETADGTEYATDRLVAASWSDADYLHGLDADLVTKGSKEFVRVDEHGRTGVDGLYAAGRLAEQYHQAAVCAGHGATVGVTVVKESPVEFYHDWVTPEGYFTGRGREVPPACEEIPEAETRERDERSRQTVLDRFADPVEDPPTMHPSVATEEE